LMLAETRPGREILSVLERSVGESAMMRLKSIGQRMQQSGGPVTYYPSQDYIRLYCSTGVCRIDKAESMLGYRPRFDFTAGFELTARYLENKKGST